jgi:hypothetical protein
MPRVSLSHTVRPSDDAVFRDLDGEAVVLNLSTGIYFGLNEVGTRIWQLIDQFGELAAVHESLLREFEVDPDTASRDLIDLVAQLADRGLVRVE